MKRMLVTFAAIAALAVPPALAAPSAAGNASFMIIHVRKGCHVWVAGRTASPTSKVTLARGGTISFLNRDTDGQRLVELAGPAKLRLPALGRNSRATVTFPKAGVYKLGTKIFEVKGMPELETVGPDNVLRMTVVVR